MPWNERHFPRSMANLPPQVRGKAVAIANALLERGYEEGRAIRIAIAQARRWQERPYADQGLAGSLWRFTSPRRLRS
jgi:uncharacterized protein YdaT